MKKLILSIMLVLLPSVILSQESFKLIPTGTLPLPVSYYEDLIYLDQGPINWIAENEEDEIHGIVFRVSITISEIYNSLIVEKMTVGAEGSDRKIVSAKEMETYKFADSFNITGEFAGLEFAKWQSYDSFEFTIHGRRFFVSNIDFEMLKISEIKNNVPKLLPSKP